MSQELLRQFLLGCTVVNYCVLLIWFIAYINAGEGMRRLHGRWFRLSEEQFMALHYGGMAVYKIGILLFNLVPWAVLTFLNR
jgi:hypothetical protein